MKGQENELAIFSLDKAIDLKATVKTIADNILMGNVDECKAGIILKRMSKLHEEVLKVPGVKEAIIDDTILNLEKGKPTRVFGATVSHAVVHTYFKFDGCNDPLWNELDNIVRNATALKKEREAYLKTLIPTISNLVPMGIRKTDKTEIIEHLPKLIWEESGEVVEVSPPIKGQKMGVKYSKM